MLSFNALSDLSVFSDVQYLEPVFAKPEDSEVEGVTNAIYGANDDTVRL